MLLFVDLVVVVVVVVIVVEVVFGFVVWLRRGGVVVLALDLCCGFDGCVKLRIPFGRMIQIIRSTQHQQLVRRQDEYEGIETTMAVVK
jgi:hypothetical protein